ncbi:MAG: ATP-binding protein [Desulfobacteraceae bacterium]|nr:MAG: ATP-binding protein [Desulfobacteraceae bacterium]
MQKYDTFKMTLPNDASYLPIVQACVRELAKKFGFNPDDIYKIELGLEETFMNVIEHAFEKGEESTFDIICRRIPKGMEIIVKEQGLPFDVNRLPRYTQATDIDQVPTSGLGTYLTKELLDEVSFRNLGSKGKETRLVKYLKSANIAEYETASGIEDEKKAPETPALISEKIEYTVRLMRPEDAIEISKGAYRSHGYTFFDDSIYYPEQITHLNETGKMISAVAVTQDNVFMGHGALIYPYVGAKIAEFNFFFVNPEYRGQACMGRINDHLFAVEKKHELSGVYGFAVTNHVFTQKTMVKFGFVDCGIALATSPATWLFKGIEGDMSQRISVTVGFRYMKKPETLTLYPPARHLEIIAKIYGWMNVEHQYRSPAPAELVFKEDHSAIETVVHTSEGCAEVLISAYGAQVLKELKAIVRDLCLRQVSSIILSVSLENPLTCFLVPEFEKMGFFFSGLLPHSMFGDVLVLQYLNNVALDYEKLKIHTNRGWELLAYIKSCDPNIQ